MDSQFKRDSCKLFGSDILGAGADDRGKPQINRFSRNLCRLCLSHVINSPVRFTSAFWVRSNKVNCNSIHDWLIEILYMIKIYSILKEGPSMSSISVLNNFSIGHSSPCAICQTNEQCSVFLRELPLFLQPWQSKCDWYVFARVRMM